MPKANTIQPDRKLSILLKGSPGFGKTIAAASMAVDGPVYLAYYDKNSPVELVNFFKKHRPELLDRIEYDVYSSSNAHEYVNKLFQFQERGCLYIGIITDSATTLTSAAVNWSLGFRGKAKKDKDARDRDTPLFIPDFDEYKVETGMVTQILDVLRTLPVHNIWTCHPLPKMNIEQSGTRMVITKSNSIVTYGAKVGAMIPAQFSEVYHFAKESDWSGDGKNKIYVITDQVGDDFAKTNYNLPRKIDITDKLFWEVMKPLYLGEEVTNEALIKEEPATPKMPWMK